LKNLISDALEKLPMKNAYECKEQYTREGKCIKREWAIGPIVPWSIVALVGIIAGAVAGHALNIPAEFWHLLK
jgi:hypothetical protein